MQINGNYNVNSMNFKGVASNKIGQAVKFENQKDSFELSFKGESSKTVEQKQDLLQNARSQAAGWSILFGPFSTLYYGLRSENKVAKQFDLDPEQDKQFIKKIKRQQMVCTIPSVIPGAGIVPGLICWLYNKNLDSSKLEV